MTSHRKLLTKLKALLICSLHLSAVFSHTGLATVRWTCQACSPPQGLCPFCPHQLEYSASHLHMACSLISQISPPPSCIPWPCWVSLTSDSFLPNTYQQLNLYSLFLSSTRKSAPWGSLTSLSPGQCLRVSSRYWVNKSLIMNELSGTIRAVFFFLFT